MLIYAVCKELLPSIMYFMSTKSTEIYSGINDKKKRLSEKNIDMKSPYDYCFEPATSTGQSSNGSTIPLLQRSLTIFSEQPSLVVSNLP